MAITTTTVKRVPVWSGGLRLSHWLMAVAMVVLLLTGWWPASTPQQYTTLLDYHYLAGYALIAGLLLRLYLLWFGRATDLLADLVVRRRELGAMADMLRFYLSLGRWRLPAWYAHNPLWKPLYLALLALLLAQVLSGVFADAPYRVAGRELYEWHALGAVILAAICGLHLIAVFLHDLKGSGSDVSAMISGQRIFLVQPLQDQNDPGVQQIAPGQIGRPPRKPGDD